jgi:hypothetical protein
VQYSNAGVLAGSTSVRIEQDSLKREIATAAPSAPTTGILEYAQNVAGRPFLFAVDSLGIRRSRQRALFEGFILQWLPGTGTTLSIAYGDTWTARNNGNGAAQSHPTRATTNFLSSLKRAAFGTGTTTSGSSGIQSTNIAAFRGNAAKIGGFFFHSRFSVETYLSSIRLFNGLSANNAVLNAQPSY